jgi:hypothetical protein
LEYLSASPYKTSLILAVPEESSPEMDEFINVDNKLINVD